MTPEQQFQNLIAEAKLALKAGNLAEAQSLRAQAEDLKKNIEEGRLLDQMEAPVRPGLPGSTKGGSMPTYAKPAPVVDMEGEAMYEQEAQKAFYTMRFGEEDKAIKAILVDLHGVDYTDAYWQQRQAFNHYMRRGERELGKEEFGILKQIVMTPAAVKAALLQGVDSVRALKATMVEAIDTLGGFAVPVDFQARVIERLQGMTVMRGRASVDNTSRDMVEIPVSTGGNDQYSSAVRVRWVDETPAAGTADTNLTFGLESIPIHTVMAETGLSRNLIEDSAFNIEQFLVRKYAEAIAIDEDNKFLIGTGVKTPQGILPGGTNALGLTQRVSGHATLITWDSLISMVYAIPSQYRANAVWIANRFFFEAIAKLRSDSAAAGDQLGNYLWNPFQATGGADGTPTRLLGFPILEQEVMPDVAANTFPLVFGDLGGYQIFDRVGMTVERYLDSATARQNMIMFVMRRRLGGQVVEPWRLSTMKVAAA
jgi:HK97 family phage major capsid protein